MIARACPLPVVCLVLLCLCARGCAQDEDLAWAVSQAPADACLVIAVRGVAEFEASVKALAGPDAGDVDLVKAIEDDLPAGAFDGRGPLLIMVPVTPKGFEAVGMLRLKDASKLEGETIEGSILKVIPHPPDPSVPPRLVGPQEALYVLKMGTWAAFSDNLAAVKAVASAASRLALTGSQRAAIGGHQIWIHANPKPLAAAARRGIASEEKRLEAANGQVVPPAFSKTLEWMVGLLDQTRAIGLVADVKEAGASAEIEVALAEDSALLAAAGAGLPLEGFKGGLPATDSLVLGGWFRLDWAKAMPPVKSLIRPLMDILAGPADTAAGKRADEFWADCDRWGAVIGPDGALVMELAPPGQGIYRMVHTFAVKDPAEYRKLVARGMTSSMNFTNLFAAKMSALPGMPPVKIQTGFNENAETIEGLPVDRATVKMEVDVPPDASPETRERMKAAAGAVYGPQGMVVRVACVDKRGVVALGDAETMARAIRAVRGRAPDLAADGKVAAAVGRLPKGGCAAGVMSLGNYVYMTIAMTERAIAQSMPEEVRKAAAGLRPLERPPRGDLAAIGGRLDGRSIRLVLDVPPSEVRNAVTVGKQGADRMMWYMRKQHELCEKQPPPAGPPAAEVKKDG